MKTKHLVFVVCIRDIRCSEDSYRAVAIICQVQRCGLEHRVWHRTSLGAQRLRPFMAIINCDITYPLVLSVYKCTAKDLRQLRLESLYTSLYTLRVLHTHRTSSILRISSNTRTTGLISSYAVLI